MFFIVAFLQNVCLCVCLSAFVCFCMITKNKTHRLQERLRTNLIDRVKEHYEYSSTIISKKTKIVLCVNRYATYWRCFHMIGLKYGRMLELGR